jgi:hypothetical protein
MRLGVWLSFVVACGGGAARTPARPGPARVTLAPVASAAAPAPPPVPEPSGSANPRVLAEIPATAASRSDLFENRYMGFTADDAYLGYEVSRCDPCPTELHFVSPTKPPLDLSYYYDPGHYDAALEKKQNAEVRRRVDALGVAKKPQRTLRGPFPFPDLVFASKTARSDATGKVTVLFGARVDRYAPVFPMRVDLGPMPGFGTKMDPGEQARVAKLPPDERAKEIEQWNASWLLSEPLLTYANVTKDGSDVGIVAVATGTLWYETGGVARMGARAFAGRVYNDTAMRLHAAKKYAEAAALFEKAEIASPATSLFSYNLACARARLRDPRAKDALARAIAHGGEPIKTRARADADFAEVSAEPWFQSLVGR